jgi:hypothetical protein
VVSTRNVILVVLATVVIFATGLITGGLLVKQRTPPANDRPIIVNRFEGIRRAVDDPRLNLDPQQRRRIETIIRDKQELIADYFRILDPDLQNIFRKTLEEIRQQLRPEQRQRFDEIGRQRMPRRFSNQRPPSDGP